MQCWPTSQRMREISERDLENECALFVRHLASLPPSSYVTAKYVAAHAQELVERPAGDALDALLVRVAARGRAYAAVADAYSRFTRPGGTLRRKLVLLAAIMESAPATYHAFEPPPPTRASFTIGRIALHGAMFGFVLIASVVVLGPAHLWLRVSRPAAPHTRESVVDS